MPDLPGFPGLPFPGLPELPGELVTRRVWLPWVVHVIHVVVVGTGLAGGLAVVRMFAPEAAYAMRLPLWGLWLVYVLVLTTRVPHVTLIARVVDTGDGWTAHDVRRHDIVGAGQTRDEAVTRAARALGRDVMRRMR
jgi:hypothetical protein